MQGLAWIDTDTSRKLSESIQLAATVLSTTGGLCVLSTVIFCLCGFLCGCICQKYRARYHNQSQNNIVINMATLTSDQTVRSCDHIHRIWRNGYMS